MLGLFVVVLISWAVLKFYGSNLGVLGLLPTAKRSIQFFSGFLLAAIGAAVYFYSLIQILDARVEVNSNFGFFNFLNGSWWALRSVLLEELMFRGALLFIAIGFLGKKKAFLLSAVVFGIFHWFSYNLFGNMIQMIYVFIITGVSGYIFAYAYGKTGSLYLPIGLHFGWNLLSIVVFSEGPLGEQLLISHTEISLGGIWSLYSFLYQIAILPIITLACLKEIPRLKFFSAPKSTKKLDL
ncbi:MAG: type II CAAX endopeptidase family protein [Salinimicrobium sp.]